LIQCEIINIHAGAENRPQFTFGFSALFVNRISSVSTGFFRFFSVLSEIRFILPQKTAENALSCKSKAKIIITEKFLKHWLPRLRNQR
jgi:hypothetical protein